MAPLTHFPTAIKEAQLQAPRKCILNAWKSIEKTSNLINLATFLFFRLMQSYCIKYADLMTPQVWPITWYCWLHCGLLEEDFSSLHFFGFHKSINLVTTILTDVIACFIWSHSDWLRNVDHHDKSCVLLHLDHFQCMYVFLFFFHAYQINAIASIVLFYDAMKFQQQFTCTTNSGPHMSSNHLPNNIWRHL